jgi:hypothetical protein
MTANSISGEIIQLLCHDTFPVNEESYEDQEEILLRLPVTAPLTLS